MAVMTRKQALVYIDSVVACEQWGRWNPGDPEPEVATFEEMAAAVSTMAADAAAYQEAELIAALYLEFATPEEREALKVGLRARRAI